MDENMSDDIDRAQNEVERSLGEALRARKPEGPLPTGECLWCKEPIEGVVFLWYHDIPKRWCDTYCRDMWAKHPP